MGASGDGGGGIAEGEGMGGKVVSGISLTRVKARGGLWG